MANLYLKVVCVLIFGTVFVNSIPANAVGGDLLNTRNRVNNVDASAEIPNIENYIKHSSEAELHVIFSKILNLPESTWTENDDAIQYEASQLLSFDGGANINTNSEVATAFNANTALSVMVKDAPICVLCETIVERLEMILKNPYVQQEIKHLIKLVCYFLPKTIKDTCNKFLTTYADIMISFITTMPPKKMCSLMMLCMPLDEPHLNKQLEQIEIDNIMNCRVCTGASMFLLPHLRETEDTSTITTQDMISVACDDLPGKYYENCSELIKIYGPSFKQFAAEDYTDDSQACAAIGQCFIAGDNSEADKYSESLALQSQVIYNAETAKSTENAILQTVDGNALEEEPQLQLGCRLCRTVLGKLIQIIGTEKNSARAKRVLHKICKNIPKVTRGICFKFEKKYFDKIFKLVLQRKTSKYICNILLICATPENLHEILLTEVVSEESPENALMQIVAERAVEQELQSPSGILNSNTALGHLRKDAPKCMLCEIVAKQLELVLEKKTFQANVKHIILHICQHLPEFIKKNCNEFVYGYADAIFHLIARVEPNEICEFLKLCMPTEALIEHQQDVANCRVCNGASMFLLPYLKETEDLSMISITDMISVACDYLPGKYYENCSDLITVYGQTFIILSAEGHTDDNTVCATIGQCSMVVDDVDIVLLGVDEKNLRGFSALNQIFRDVLEKVKWWHIFVFCLCGLFIVFILFRLILLECRSWCF